MSERKPLVVRAMELAAGGGFSKVTELKPILKREGYFSVDATLEGAGFRTQLRSLMAEARRVPARTSR